MTPVSISKGRNLTVRAAAVWVVILALTLVGSALAACAANRSDSSSPAPTPDGRVTGRVLAGPTCPVYQEPLEGQPTKQPTGCQEQPVQADVRVLEVHSGRIVAIVRSAADGRFQLSLAAGQYELQALDPTKHSPAGPPQLVVVQPHTVTQITLQWDTGIR